MKHNLGYQYEDACEPVETSGKKSKKEKETHYPEFTLGSEYGDGPSIKLPDVDSKGVGSECQANVTLIVKEVGMKDKKGQKERRYYRFCVKDIEFKALPNDPDKGKKTKLDSMAKEMSGNY